jgi:hypothetical protein
MNKKPASGPVFLRLCIRGFVARHKKALFQTALFCNQKTLYCNEANKGRERELVGVRGFDRFAGSKTGRPSDARRASAREGAGQPENTLLQRSK